MNEALALKLLRQIMEWDEETATREYRWIRLMSLLKFDGYRDYVAGVRFSESLAGWLSQFDLHDRAAAYDFVKTRLIYFSPSEIHRLVDQLFPRFIEPKLRRAASERTGVPPYLVMVKENSKQELIRERRRTLFIGLSDGARLDILRRANAGVLVNDQIVLATHIDEEKWKDLGAKLRKDKNFDVGSDPKFNRVCLVDDFTGSGTSFLRRKKDGSWSGKLRRFGETLAAAKQKSGPDFPLTDDFCLHIHHYISSHQAHETIAERLSAISADLGGNAEWFSIIEVSEGVLLPETVKLSEADGAIWDLCDRYYDHGLYEQLKEHLEEAGQTHIRHGYGDSALPVVLEHNCPNNTITLIWSETEGTSGHAMRPLFPRRHRHS
jgi:hypothetical protein